MYEAHSYPPGTQRHAAPAATGPSRRSIAAAAGDLKAAASL